MMGRFPELLDRKLADLTPWLIEKWRLRRKGDGISNVTVNRDLDDLKAALARAADWGVVAGNPIAGVKRAKVDGAFWSGSSARMRSSAYAPLSTRARSASGASGTAPTPGAASAATTSCRTCGRLPSPTTSSRWS